MSTSSATSISPPHARVLYMPRRRPHKWHWVVGVLVAILGIVSICIRVVIVRAQPILRLRVIETLSARFQSRVELADLHVWIADGVHVEGRGLRIFGARDPNPWEPGVQPLLEIGEFRFQTALRSLFRDPMHVDTIYVTGLTMNIPPKNERQQMNTLRKRSGRISIAVDHFICSNTKLIINTIRPSKPPLEFDIGELRLKDIGPGQPLRFEAQLVNPKPVGNIQSTGQFGPLNQENPRDSAIAGNYSFTHADLGTLKGIAGILSSTGKYEGTLGRIVVDGETDTPDFRIAVGGHSIPLHTDFHAIVDGTDGDTYLDPVKARFLHTSFTAKGKVVRLSHKRGHDIELNISLGHANIEDLLELGVKTDPPIMTGAVAMHTKLSLEPGEDTITNRLNLAGAFQIPQAYFTNDKIQSRIDSFSLRSQGKAKLAQNHDAPSVPSEVRGSFALTDGVLTFFSLHFLIPGTHTDMTGRYSLDGGMVDFHGILDMDAKLSRLTTGWKSILLKPIDPFFQKHAAGTELPFRITGTRDQPHFALDFHHKGNRPAEIPDDATAGR